MITTDVLRDRIDDVIAVMEKQFMSVTPALVGVIEDALRGDRSAFRELQTVGRAVVAPLIDQFGLAAGALAAEWYDANRDLLGVGGVWAGALVQDPNVDTGPIIGGSLKDFSSVDTVLFGIQSGMDVRVRQAANGTVMDSVLQDRQSLGWGRVASAGCCEYCGLLAGRGAVYRTEHTATFSPHLNCKCQALPLWQADPTGVSMRSRADTIATRRPLTDEQRARQNRQARIWIEQNKATLGLQ